MATHDPSVIETGVIRRMDTLGRVTIPRELRRTCHIPDGGYLAISVTDEGILLKRYDPKLSMASRIDDLIEHTLDTQNDLGCDVQKELLSHLDAIRKLLADTDDF